MQICLIIEIKEEKHFTWHFLSWTFFNSPLCRLFKIVQDFKDSAIFDQVINERLTEEQNKIQQDIVTLREFVALNVIGPLDFFSTSVIGKI